MTRPILVTGGTGTLGRQVGSRLQEPGREVRVLSRRRRNSQDGLVFATGGLSTGEGLAAAVRGIGTIVHCASNRKGDAEAKRNLVRAAAQEKSSQATSPHLMYISIAGIDQFPRGCFKTKLEAEGVIADSGLPSTTLRATQFYELIRNGAVRLTKYPRPGTDATLGRRSRLDFLVEKPAGEPALGVTAAAEPAGQRARPAS